jgi:hypothetical protein
MTRILVAAVILLALVAFAAPVAAQTVVDRPTTLMWDHDLASYASTAKYVMGYFLLPVKADNTCDTAATIPAAPVQTSDIAKPATTTGIDLTAPIPSHPIGCYVGKLRAVDVSGLLSDWSNATGVFVIRPASPSKPVVK